MSREVLECSNVLGDCGTSEEPQVRDHLRGAGDG